MQIISRSGNCQNIDVIESYARAKANSSSDSSRVKRYGKGLKYLEIAEDEHRGKNL